MKRCHPAESNWEAMRPTGDGLGKIGVCITLLEDGHSHPLIRGLQ